MPDHPPLRGPGLSFAEALRDEEARIAALPPCPLPALDRAALTLVALDVCPGRLWLPELERAEPMDVPDDTWQGWEWPSDGWEWLLLSVIPWDPRNFGLAITVPRPELSRIAVAGRVMKVRAFGPGDAGWAGKGYVAEVTGFFEARTHFWAQAVAATPERRATLLAAVGTLELGTT